MDIAAFFTSLETALLARLESVGGALALSFGTLLMGYTADERSIIIDVKQHWLAAYRAEKAKGVDDINAIENASTSAYNTFCADEADEFTKIKSSIIVFAEGAAKRVAGVLVGG